MKSCQFFSLRRVFALCTAWFLIDLVPLDRNFGTQVNPTLKLTKSAFAEGKYAQAATPNNAEPSGAPSGAPPADNKNRSPKNNNRRIKYEYAQNNDTDYYLLFQPFYSFNSYSETAEGKPFMKEKSEYLTGLSTELIYDSTSFVANASFTYGFGTATYSAYADDGSTYSTPGHRSAISNRVPAWAIIFRPCSLIFLNLA